ncbi:MAG: HAD hydrolase family protein [Oscillospiraceae bacterium]|nr:HAD hydrolase family protein [Oscillospiraceae bacterium]
MKANKLILFSDLDGTLIFSAKRKQVGDIVIERKNGEPISCITARQAELFPRLRNVIPVTTRSIEQYRRIEFANFGFSPKYALCDNGGTLLVDGEPDNEWARWSAEIFAECEDELARFRGLLESDPRRSFEVRLVDGLFLFTKSDDPNVTLEYLGKSRLCECFATGEKVYVIPRELNKGTTVRRLAKRLGAREFAAAGDSLMDVSMLNTANIAVFPEDIVKALPALSRPKGLPADVRPKYPRVRHSYPREGFPEFVTEFADKL